MYKIEVSLNDLVYNVNRLLEGELTYIDKRNGRAAWIAGNHLITATRVTEQATEFELVNALEFPADADEAASRGWKRFIDKLVRNIGPVYFVQDLERVENKTLTLLGLLKDPEKWQEHNKWLSALAFDEVNALLLQAGEEYLGPNRSRYRLTQEEIERRKKIVKEAEKLKSAGLLWKQVAKQLIIPERSLREYRHNPIYK
jgi:hypothetical protein